MKTLRVDFLKAFFSMMVFVLALSSCAKSSESGKEAKAGAPDMDIHAAVMSGNVEVVKQHIKAGSDLNIKETMSGSTPLIAASTFNQKEIAQLLIDAGADLALKNNDGATPLHVAAFFGRIEIVQMLIDAKADKSLRNNFGATARESVMGDFAQVKPIYDMLYQQLKPFGFELDFVQLEKARPTIAKMLE